MPVEWPTLYTYIGYLFNFTKRQFIAFVNSQTITVKFKNKFFPTFGMRVKQRQ